jgi:hypothetical protein
MTYEYTYDYKLNRSGKKVPCPALRTTLGSWAKPQDAPTITADATAKMGCSCFTAMLNLLGKGHSKLSLSLIKHQPPMERGVDVKLRVFLTSALNDPASLSPGKRPRNTLDTMLDGLLSRYGSSGQKNLLPIPRIEPRFQGHPARSLVVTPTEPSRLQNSLGTIFN